MAEILILGAGVMGSALGVPACDNGHRVRLAATPLDGDVLAALSRDRGAHPRLKAALPDVIEPVDAAVLTPGDAARADLVVIGVSSPGVGWAVETLARLRPNCPVALVTKGLVPGTPPLTYADAVPAMLAERGIILPALVGIGGPCIARELAERRPTAVVYASATAGAAAAMRDLFQTPYYRISLSDDVVGVEACAAMKNFFAIGVSAMLSRHQRDGEPVKNPVAAAFQQAVDEMAALSHWLGGTAAAAHGLAGVGDLHVTVGGGRNSRLGRLMGEGLTAAQALEGPLAGETVEGVDVGRVLAAPLAAAWETGALSRDAFVLADALITSITTGTTLAFDVAVPSDERRPVR